mgnify:CR=1 FL=1
MSSELYIVRHAIAAQRGQEWPDDSKRPLTERGIERFKEIVDGEHDEIPERAFYMQGGIEQVLEEAKGMRGEEPDQAAEAESKEQEENGEAEAEAA